ncbi:SDR family oxidoreductase [Corallococcus sp. AB049A]|uniref:SDR family oxidoreductase n=1 Tax=Corallococcus interemptor TaxID=2316720 RepID=A0A3A8QH11_9BACT|nr:MULTISPECIES: SDR family oxidoreductase [Corallococcus]RKH48453.1 SDR family oxidoreductase [Corallococcus sp. AB050B]RKH64182.1 SDR family oxidoreductase [Corallococcus interemptor]RKI61382.1 SDR family oxidoreductase [Corallococcus sp. AB049A]
MQTTSSPSPVSRSLPRGKGFPYAGHRALVTGASSGLGVVFARELAARGMDLILVARSEDRMRALAEELKNAHGIQADVIALDLGREGAGRELHARCQEKGLRVDLLVNNAGFGTHGAFDAAPFARQHEQVMLNVTSLVDTSHLFLPDMLARGVGGILNVASIAGFQPVPYMAIYAASKAFVLSFTEALSEETRERGVRVLALCPGPVQTAFFDVVGTEQAAVGPKATAEEVVLHALKALDQGRASVVPGWRNWLQANLTRFTPRWLGLRVAAGMMRPPSVTPAVTAGV